MVYFGNMSYTLYLVHLVSADLFIFSGIALPFSESWNLAIGGFALTILLGAVIWHFYEKPIYGLRKHFPYR